MSNELIDKELHLLRRISTIVLAEPHRLMLDLPEPGDVLDRMVEEIASATDAAAATIFLRDDAPNAEAETFLVRATKGLNPNCVGVTRIRSGEGLAGAAIAERRIIRVEDGPGDPRYVYKRESGEERYRGFLAAPIMKGERALGILVLHFHEQRTARDDEVRLVAAIAEQVGFTLEHARLTSELRERMASRQALHDLSLNLSALPDRRQVIDAVVRQVPALIPSRAVALRLYDPVSNRLVVEAFSGEMDRNHPALRPCRIGEGVAGAVAAEGKVLLINDPSSDPRAQAYRDCSGVLAAPLRQMNRIIGSIELIDRRTRDSAHAGIYSESEGRLLMILAQIASEAYARVELYSEMESMALIYRRKNHELSILNRLSREIQGSSQANEIMFVILTGVTSGHGLGYNRAVLLLLDEQKQELRGVMGIGAMMEDVNRVWTEAPERYHSLEDYLASPEIAAIEESAFNKLTRTIRVPLTGEGSLIERVLLERRPINIRSAATLLGADRTFAHTIRTQAFAMVPVRSRELAVGVLAVDNCFNQKPIQDEDLVLVQTIANQCGLALEGARLVTELSGAMEKLESTTERLVDAERMAAIGEVAAGVAHDIRNPLTAIGGFTRRLGKRLPPTDPGQRYVEIIEHEVQRLETLAGEVLELASNRERVLERLDPLGMALRWKEKNEIALRRKKVSVEIGEGGNMIEADARMLARAIENLLNNAYDAVGPGGVIRCFCATAEKRVTVHVVDNGCGMKQEEIERIFDAFYTTKTEGTGLGLPLVRKTVDAHGGTIQIKSVPGKGTTFLLSFPMP